MIHFWNERYSAAEYAYGTEPNEFFKETIDALPPGRLLVPGAGEGRDAVYAAQQGWNVQAFDLSTEGRRKALELAHRENVTLDFQIQDAATFSGIENSFDLIALIFFHLPPAIRKPFHQKLISLLKPGGLLVLEAFQPQQLGNSSGGPADINMLLTKEVAAEEFAGLEIIQNEYRQIILNEGLHHVGKADVLRFLGRKKEV